MQKLAKSEQEKKDQDSHFLHSFTRISPCTKHQSYSSIAYGIRYAFSPGRDHSTYFISVAQLLLCLRTLSFTISSALSRMVNPVLC